MPVKPLQRRKYKRYLKEFQGLLKQIPRIDQRMKEAREKPKREKEYNAYVKKLGKRLGLFQEFLEETRNPSRELQSFHEKLDLQERTQLENQVKKAVQHLKNGRHEKAFSIIKENTGPIETHASAPMKKEIYEVWTQELQKEFGPQVVLAKPYKRSVTDSIQHFLKQDEKKSVRQLLTEFQKQYEHGKMGPWEKKDLERKIQLLKKAEKHGFQRIVELEPIGQVMSYSSRFGDVVNHYRSPQDIFKHEKSHAESTLFDKMDFWSMTMEELLAYTKEDHMRVLTKRDYYKGELQGRIELLYDRPAYLAHLTADRVVEEMHKKGITKQELKQRLEKEKWDAKKVLLSISPELSQDLKKIKQKAEEEKQKPVKREW
jgi:hypothetical protein